MTTTSPGRRIWTLLLRIAAIALVAVGIYFFARDIDGKKLWAALTHANGLWLAAAAVMSFVNMFWKSTCWYVMLRPSHPVPILRLYRYTIAAFAGSLLLPARAGEAARLWLLKRRDGVPLTSSGGVAISEKLVDGCAMIISVSPTLVLIDGLPPWVWKTVALFVGGAAVVLTAVLILRRRLKPTGVVGKLAAAMTPFDRPQTFALALGACLGAWVSDFICVLLVLAAVHVQVAPAIGLLILLGVNMAILIPSMPGNAGSLELGAVTALNLVGVPADAAMAFALLYHAVQAIPLLLVGLADIRLLLWARRGEAAEAAG